MPASSTSSGSFKHPFVTLFVLAILFGTSFEAPAGGVPAAPAAPVKHEWPPAKLVTASHGVVASENETCSEIGRDVLKEGGSAVDAAIASSLCIGTLNSFSSGIGGGGFMLVRNPGGKAEMFNFRETAIGSATESMYVSNPENAKTGGMSIGIPGEVSGFEVAHKTFGKLPWKRLFEPSIKLAEHGFKVSKLIGKRLEQGKDFILGNPGFRAIYAPNGKLLQEGETCVRKNLAKTLKTIAEGGAKAFYTGPLGKTIVEEVHAAGGQMTEKDLAGYKARVEKPLESTFHGMRVITGNAPTSGPVLLAVLNILEKFKIGQFGGSKEMTALDAHHIVEAFKYGYALRSKTGDPEFVKNWKQLEQMISKELADKMRRGISDERTYQPDHYTPLFDTSDNHGTMHLSVVDKQEQVVSLMSTINNYFGSKIMGPHTGIVYNDEMDDFSTPGTVNSFGYPASPSNYIVPGKRPLSSSVPTIIEKDGKFEFVAGGSGGSRIITGTLMIIIYNIIYGMPLDAAINAPRMHHQLFPHRLHLEDGFNPDIAAKLKAFGHDVQGDGEHVSQATVQAVRRVGNQLHAVSDPRKYGVAAGY